MSLIKKTGWYSNVLTLIIVTLILKQYSLVFMNFNANHGNVIDYMICVVLVLSYILYDVQQGYVRVDNLILVLFFIFLLLILKKQQLLTLFILCISFLHVTPVEAIFVYRNAVSFAMLISFILALFTNNMFNLSGEAIALGFVNQNITAFCLAFLGILFSLKVHNDGYLYFVGNGYTYFLLLVDAILVTFLFGDYTALILILLFLLFYFTFIKTKILEKKISYFFIVLIPVILTWLTYWLAMNFNRYFWINSLDHFLSGRINIWNYYFIRMPVKSISSNRLFVVSTWGADYTPHQGAFDGTYAYLLYIFGILFTIIYVLGLMICNYKLLKNKNYIILVLILSLEICGFSENMLYSTALCFGSIFAMLSFHKNWFNNMGKTE